jgi:hypothetical protein
MLERVELLAYSPKTAIPVVGTVFAMQHCKHKWIDRAYQRCMHENDVQILVQASHLDQKVKVRVYVMNHKYAHVLYDAEYLTKNKRNYDE